MKSDNQELIELGHNTRCRGNTYYILNAAFNNPEVIIVCSSHAHAKQLEHTFSDRINNMYLISRWFWLKRHKAIMPVFVSYCSVRNVCIGNHRPVVIDVSILGQIK